MYGFNKNFFESIDSEIQAYWLGFIISDGCIYNNRLQIELQEKDKEHLHRFKKDIESQHPLHYLKPREKFPGSYSHPAYRLRIGSKKLCQDLFKLKVTPKKTLIATFPEIKLELQRHLIRGLLDGDGCIHFNSEKTSGNKYICFLGSEDIIKNIVSCIGINKNYQLRKNHYIVKYNSILHFKYLYNYLYRDATVFLERKRVIAEQLKS